MTEERLLAEDDLEWEEWNPEKISFRSHMVAGSLAGLAEHVSLFPIDTIKTHIQCQKCGAVTPWQSWLSAVRIVHNEGLFRLWRGVSAMFAGCIPAHAAYFSIFEAAKVFYGADKVGHHPLAAAMSGATAALSHDMIMTPFDTIKQRMQLGYYRSVVHCIREVTRVEGIRSFYVSLPATLAMNLPHGAIVIAVNESMRKMFTDGDDEKARKALTVSASLISGCVAGGVAAMITTPLDVIKTRLQTQHLAPCTEQQIVQAVEKNMNTLVPPKPIQYDGCIEKTSNAKSAFTNISSVTSEVTPGRQSMASSFAASQSLEAATISRMSMREVVHRIWTQEGPAGFFRGAVPRMMSQAPAVAISWTVYESLKNALNRLENDGN